MEIRYPTHPRDFQHYTTAQIRQDYLIEHVFQPGELRLTYSQIDRIIVGGACPTDGALVLEGGQELGSAFFLERRELGVINLGGPGTVTADGVAYALNTRDGLYLGMGVKEVAFTSAQSAAPAKFYFNSAPAHAAYPNKQITLADAKQVKLGSKQESNQRTIYQYVHPAVLPSCQLVMGLTMLEPENVWNTMPCHTHDRRMEVYLYFNLPDNAVVFHFMGEPTETRHVVIRNEQAVIMPSWSIHAGVGTTNYAFIWGMVGENQTFTDMDHVPMTTLR